METIIRPLPVPGDVAIRSALLALAKLGADLQNYNEEGRTIVAQMPKWFGVSKASILITVQDFGENSRLELQIPDKAKANELLDQISIYLVDGHRAAGDMTMRWVKKQEKTLAQSAGSTVGKAIRRLKTTPASPTATLPAEATTAEATETTETVEGEMLTEAESAAIDEASQNNQLMVPEFIKANQAHDQVQITVSPDFFVDRSSHLEKCPNCENVVLRGNQFCSQCGRPITMEAVSQEVNEGGRNTARSSLVFAILAIVCNVVAGYFLFAPTLASFFTGEPVAAFSTISIFLAMLLGLAPSLFLAFEAKRMAKTAEIYANFRFNKKEEGRTMADLGTKISWVSIGVSGLLILVLMLRTYLVVQA